MPTIDPRPLVEWVLAVIEELPELRARRQTLGLLRSLEWSDTQDGVARCPVCGGPRPDHAAPGGCPLAEVLEGR